MASLKEVALLLSASLEAESSPCLLQLGHHGREGKGLLRKERRIKGGTAGTRNEKVEFRLIP